MAVRSTVSPISQRSTAAAALRPSAMDRWLMGETVLRAPVTAVQGR